MKKIAFGCDHVGFMLKEDILAHLRARGIDVVDKGTCSPERTDYPYYASAVAQAIIDKEVDRHPDLRNGGRDLHYGQ